MHELTLTYVHIYQAELYNNTGAIQFRVDLNADLCRTLLLEGWNVQPGGWLPVRAVFGSVSTAQWYINHITEAPVNLSIRGRPWQINDKSGISALATNLEEAK